MAKAAVCVEYGALFSSGVTRGQREREGWREKDRPKHYSPACVYAPGESMCQRKRSVCRVVYLSGEGEPSRSGRRRRVAHALAARRESRRICHPFAPLDFRLQNKLSSCLERRNSNGVQMPSSPHLQPRHQWRSHTSPVSISFLASGPKFLTKRARCSPTHDAADEYIARWLVVNARPRLSAIVLASRMDRFEKIGTAVWAWNPASAGRNTQKIKSNSQGKGQGGACLVRTHSSDDLLS